MGASVDDERTAAETLLPPFAIPPFHAHSDDVWVSLGGRPVPVVQAQLQRFFAFLGRRVSGSPGWTILLCIACVAFCMLGLIGMHVVTDPLHLWVPRASRAAKDKAAFDSEFGPFYRIEQIILSTKPDADGLRPPILSEEAIELVCFCFHLLFGPDSNASAAVRLQQHFVRTTHTGRGSLHRLPSRTRSGPASIVHDDGEHRSRVQ